jgi:hypothetical protein
MRLRRQVYAKPPQSCLISGRWNVSHVGFAVAQLGEPLDRQLSGWICGRADAERNQRLFKIEAYSLFLENVSLQATHRIGDCRGQQSLIFIYRYPGTMFNK